VFPGFRPEQAVRRIFGDPKARVITLKRRSKKQLVDVAVAFRWGGTDRTIRHARDLSCGDTRIFLEVEVLRVGCRRCGKVKQERLDFLAYNPFYTRRFAYYVGQRCRAAPIKDVAKDLALDWHTVKALDKQYMEAQLKRVGTPGPQVIGVDKISIRKGHDYRIVVSDLVRGRPIWFGGEDRSEASMSQFYAWLGKKKSSRIRLAIMDMWKPFRLATNAHAPQAAILSDKFLSSAIWARPWMRFARASMPGSRVASGATSRARNTRYSRAERISRSTARRR
jgi:transposase